MATRKLLAAPLAVGVALALSGCIAVKEQSAAQRAPGVIKLHATVCAVDQDGQVQPDPPVSYHGCKPGVNTAEGSTTDEQAGLAGDGQLLVGFRVPAGSEGPANFLSDNSDVSFAKSPSYTAKLQEKHPAGAGQKWVGYISTLKHYEPTATSARELGFGAEFTLPQPGGGATFAGPYRWRVVVDMRFATPATAGQPVTCPACVRSPKVARIPINLSAPVSDFAIAPGAAPQAPAGRTTQLPFELRYAGEGTLGALPFAFGASTDIPGATAAPSTPSAGPARNSTTPVGVNLTVPAGTRPGAYRVTLGASTGSPAVARSATTTVVVPPPPPPPPRPIGVRVLTGWQVRGKLTKVVRMRVVEAKGATVKISCKGGRKRGCPFTSKRLAGSTINVAKRFKKRLRSSAKIEVRATKAGTIGKVVTYTMRTRKVPKALTRCLPPGAKSPKRC